MPRIQRGLGDNVVYHVINRGNGRQEVFHKEKDYEAFVKLLEEAKERYPVKDKERGQATFLREMITTDYMVKK